MNIFIILTPRGFVTLFYNYVKLKKVKKYNGVSINVGLFG